MLREFLAADIEGVEGIGAVGAVFQQILFGLRLLLHGLVFAEAVAPSLHTGTLDGEDKVVIVLAVEVRHQALLPCKDLVDKKIFFIVAHRVAEVHVNDLPTMSLELVADHPMKVLVVDGMVRAESRGIIVVDDRLVGMRRVVDAEYGNKAKPLEMRS